MNYLSVCSGIEAASAAWEPLGWEPVGFSEIEKFPSAVLAHHWPDVPNLGDMTKYDEWKLRQPIDLLVGGTPCQSFSVAGLRKGLEDPRGNLTLTFLAMVEKFKPRWVVWENVPGVLSDKTNAFGQFLSGLGELGYEYAYRVLDAQHFGVPQRRRRVFVVASLGTVHPAKVLFEPESMCRDLAPSRETGKEVAGTVTRRTCSSIGADDAANGHMIPMLSSGQANAERTENVLPSLNCNRDGAPIAFVRPTFAIQNATRGKSQNGLGVGKEGELMFTLDQASQHAVAFQQNTRDEVRLMGGAGFNGSVSFARESGAGYWMPDDKSGTLRAEGENRPSRPSGVLTHNMQVRRLTPTECERLQGFPDGHTLIPWRNKDVDQCPDGPRYKAMGNSMAVPVMRWIGERINQHT